MTDSVEFVQLSWPIRNRDGLLAALRADKSFDEGPSRAVDPNDRDAPKVDRFLMLDRSQIEPKPGLNRLDIPRIEGEVLVSKDVVVLETYDDGRLDRLTDRFVARAGLNIPPAHPRTKVIRREQRYLLNLSCPLAHPRRSFRRGCRSAQPAASRVDDRRDLAQDAQPAFTRADTAPGRTGRQRRDSTSGHGAGARIHR